MNLSSLHEETIKLVSYLENKGEMKLARQVLKTFIAVFNYVKAEKKYETARL